MNKLESNGMKRITKHEARRLYRNGSAVFLATCKASPRTAVRISRRSGKTFDSVVDEFQWFNCSNEVGTYPSYYKKAGTEVD